MRNSDEQPLSCTTNEFARRTTSWNSHLSPDPQHTCHRARSSNDTAKCADGEPLASVYITTEIHAHISAVEFDSLALRKSGYPVYMHVYLTIPDLL